MTNAAIFDEVIDTNRRSAEKPRDACEEWCSREATRQIRRRLELWMEGCFGSDLVDLLEILVYERPTPTAECLEEARLFLDVLRNSQEEDDDWIRD